MQVLPVTIPPEDDELFSSWVYRASKANLFGNLDQFIRSFVRAKASEGYQYLRYDDTEEFLTFFLAQQSRTPMAELYLKTTCYGGLAPFMTSGQQIRRLNVSFRRTYGKPEFTPKVTPYTRELHRCKYCQQEELESKGFWYYHRAHQLPGVKVCHKHDSLLEVFKGKLGQEFDTDAPFEIVAPNASDDIMLRYAQFAKEILDIAPDGDVSNTKEAILDGLRQRGYSNRGTDYEKLNRDIVQYGMGQMFPVDMKRYMELQLAMLTYPSVEQTMALAFFLYGSAEALINAMPKSAHNKFFSRLESDQYQLKEPFRSNLVHLHHDCGAEFCTTAEGIASGWSCPRCDAEKDNQEILETLIAHTGSNEYICQSEFKGIDEKVTLLHNRCGNTVEQTVSRFLFENRRCECESRRKKRTLINHLASVGTFQLLKYAPTTNHIFVAHMTCGKSFECSYDRFLADTRCPHCESGVNTGIRPKMDARELSKRIYDLVGDEYTLESTEVKKGTPVKIRHNRCGNTDFYYHGKFLIGQRCSGCRTRYDGHAIKELIPYLTNEEYEMSYIDGDNPCVIRHRQSGKEHHMTFAYILQELTRPTPSPKLPCRLPARSIDDFVPTPVTTLYEKTLSCLQSTFGMNDILFRADFGISGANEIQIGPIITRMMKHGVIESLGRGIYKWKASNVSQYDVIQQKYICRRNERFGYLYGRSFAYEIGLRKEEPKMIQIATNVEARKHGRNISFREMTLYLRGSEFEITNENWMILQLLDFLRCPQKYSEFGEKHTEAVLRKHIQDNELCLEQAMPYLAQYPEWVESKLRKLYEVDQ